MGNLCSLLKSVGLGFLLDFGLALGFFSPEGPDQGVSQTALVLAANFPCTETGHDRSEYSNVGDRKSQA